jgi:hypothetical protein
MAIDSLLYVKPGDLITADFANGLLNTLSALDDRVTKLETATTPSAPGAPVLQRRNPTGTVHVGELLTLFGRNFAPIDKARVKLGTIPISTFTADSGDTSLTFTVPSGFTGLPLTTSVTVETPLGSSSPLGITLLEAQVQQEGRVLVADQTPELGQIDVGSKYLLQWEVTSETRLPETYEFSIVVTDADPPASEGDWASAVRLNVSTKQIIPEKPLTVVASVEVPDAKAARLALHVDADQLHGESTPIALTVGEEAKHSDPRIKMFLVEQPPGDPDGEENVVKLDSSQILVPAKTTGWVFVEVEFADPDAKTPVSYRFFAELETATTGWQVTGDERPPRLIQNQLGGGTGVWFGIKNTATTSASHPAVLIASAAKEKDGADDYVSFVAIPIENAG